MNGDNILLIGIDNTKVNLKQIYSTNKASELMDLYGTESIFIEPFNILKNQFEAEEIYIMNLDSWDDLKEDEEIFSQYDFTYIVPLDLRLTDSYDDIFESRRYYYSQLLVWMTERTNSTVIITGIHARYYNTLTEYLNHEKDEVSTIKNMISNLRKNNLIYVANNLADYNNANVVLSGMLLNDISEYPDYDFIGQAVFDIDYCDVDFDLVFFKNNFLRTTTVENLKNFDEITFIKSVTVDRIIKYIRRHWPEMNDFIGTAFSDYKMIKITERTKEYLKTLMDWIIYDFNIISVTSVQNPDSTVGIHINLEVWPKFTTEKYTMEMII